MCILPTDDSLFADEPLILSKTQRLKVYMRMREIRKNRLEVLDDDSLREDFYGLHKDLKEKMKELCLDTSELYEFGELLDEAANVVTPYTAFAFGMAAKYRKENTKKAYEAFLIEASVMMTTSAITKKKNRYLDTYQKAHPVTKTLFTEIHDLHGKLNVVNEYLEEFFLMGYDAG